jgi:hypothetical protein
MKIENAVALVTGANRGIGLAFTRELLARGARKVYAGARDPSAVTQSGVEAIRLDVTSRRRGAAAARAGRDALINAGVGYLRLSHRTAKKSPVASSKPTLRHVAHEQGPRRCQGQRAAAPCSTLSIVSWMNGASWRLCTSSRRRVADQLVAQRIARRKTVRRAHGLRRHRPVRNHGAKSEETSARADDSSPVSTKCRRRTKSAAGLTAPTPSHLPQPAEPPEQPLH